MNAPSVLDEQHGDFDPVTVFNLPSIMHLNIRSIGNKLELIKILLLRRSIDILALTETWLDETWHDLELTVPGYNLFRKDRSSNIQARLRVGGGIAIYIREDLNGKRRRDLESHEIEQLCLELKQHRCAPSPVLFVSSSENQCCLL